MLLSCAAAAATELDMLPLGDVELEYRLGSADSGSFYDTANGVPVEIDELVARFAEADVVLLGEEHTAMEQKLLQAEIVEGMAAVGRPIVLAMEFFQRSDNAVLDRWVRGEIDDRELLEATGWYDRGGYRWEYYQPVMDIARTHGMRIVGANVSRDIPRAVNRGGLAGLSEEEHQEVGEVTTDGSPQHRYLISRYFGDTVAMLPPGWFDNMYAAQCLWDVVMARSILAEVAEDATVVLVVGSGHIAYDLGIPRRLDEERGAAGLPGLKIATFCPATAPAPDPDGEPSGHPHILTKRGRDLVHVFLNLFEIVNVDHAAPPLSGKHQSQLYLIQIEAIYLPGYGTKIPNHNNQITNNIKITNSNNDGLVKSPFSVSPAKTGVQNLSK